MKTILVVDDMAVIRDPIAAALRLEGFTSHTAASGREALAAVRAKPPHLILLDVLMPEMDGLTFLKHLRADARLAQIPVILLTAVNDKRVTDIAVKLGVREFLIKSHFSLKNMLERIRRTLQKPTLACVPPATAAANAPAGTSQSAPAEAKPVAPVTPAAPEAVAAAAPAAPASPPALVEIPVLLAREKCIERAESAVQVSALSGVVGQVISIAASPRADLTQLATIIARDPMLSARVLQAANSAAYASNRGAIMTIPDAVKHVGCSTVRNVAAALGVFDAMPAGATPAEGDFNPIRCWQHSFAVATLCEKFSVNGDAEHADIAYLVGLCHDLGEIMFHTQFAAEYQQIIEFQRKTGKRRDELERQMLGMTHNDLIVAIMKRMALPDSIRQPIEALHDPRGSGTNNPLARVLRLANLYANSILLATSGSSRIGPISRAECRATLGSDEPAIPDGEATRCEIFGLTGVLARLSAAEEAKLMTPLYPRKSTRIWLARDKTFSKLDPIEAALNSLAEADVHDRLPQPGELTDHRGLVISARTNAVAGLTALDLKGVLTASRDYKLPVLWINGKVEAGIPNDTGVEPVTAPIPLEDVAKFVDSL